MLLHLAWATPRKGFIIVLALIPSVCFFGSVRGGETEKTAASKVESLGGKTTKDKEGKVSGTDRKKRASFDREDGAS
jgi:hypothetical protein